MRVGVVGSMIIVVIAAIKRSSDADSQITFDGDNGDIGEVDRSVSVALP
jgi:hypothetical protein